MGKLLMVAMLALLPVASQAQVSLGARLGFSPAMGAANKDPQTGEKAKMSDGVKSQIPIQLEAAYAVTPAVAVGAYFSYGFGQVADELFGGACDQAGVDCSARSIRLGVQGIYTFKASPEFVPWAGIGFGYEWGSAKAEQGADEATVKASGFELLNLQAGGDIKVGERFTVGPYVMYTLGQYGDPTIEETGEPDLELDTSSAIHSWFGFGIRGTFGL